MNHFMDYVCRGIVRSEDAIRCLNKRVNKLAKCNGKLGASLVCLGVAGLLMTSVIAAQDQEIKALRAQVSELDKHIKDVDSRVVNVANKMEEQNQQEGA